MIKYLFAIILLVLYSTVQAQNMKLDSLQAILQKTPVNDNTSDMSRRAELLIYIAHAHTDLYQGSPDFTHSRECAREALLLNHQLKNVEGVNDAYRSIAFSYELQGRYPEAIDTGLLFLHAMEQLRDTVQMILSASDIASNYSVMGNGTDNAVMYAQRCIEWSNNPNYCEPT